MEIITRKEAIGLNLKTYFTGKECTHGHVAERWVSTMCCTVCVAEKAKIWRQNNPEHRRAYRRKWNKDNPNSVRETRKKFQSRANVLRKKARLENPIIFMLYAAKARAKLCNVPFNLSVEDISMPEVCPVFGIPLIMSEGHQTDNSPTLDRLVPNLGYVKGNVIIVSAKANRIKNDATLSELQQVVSFYQNVLSV